MFDFLDKYIAVFLTGLLVSYVLTPLARQLAVRFGIVDLPNERRPHKRPTARGGGIAVVLGVHAACLMALAFPWQQFSGDLDLVWWHRFTLASLVLLVVGLVDDIRGLSPLLKLGGQILAALLIFSSGTHFGTVFGYQLPWSLDCLLVVGWLVAVINAFNLIDGLDGLASGLACISAAGLCGIFVIGRLPGNVLVLLGLIGACIGFLRYNFHPASVFLGDTGSMFLGFTLGVVSLQTLTKSTFFLSLTIPLLVLGVPIYDELLAIWRRSVRRWLVGPDPVGTARPTGVMRADLEHLHHRLTKFGLSTRRVALLLYVINTGLVVVGVLLTSFQSHAAGILLIALLAGVFVLMRHLAVIELRDTGKVILRGLRRPTVGIFKALVYPAWDMFWLALPVAVAMWVLAGPKPGFWHDWFLDLPIWVTPTFSLLALSRAYITDWTRARVLDALMLASTLLGGLLLSLGIALLIDPANFSRSVTHALIVGGLGHPAILGMRLLYRAVEELVLYFKNKSELGLDSQRVLLYGAGGRCQLFLKEQAFSNSSSFDGRTVVGLIDDELSLHRLWVYGYLVLGGLHELPNLISRHRITRIIITTDLSPGTQIALRELAGQHGIRLSIWHFVEKELEVEPAIPKSIIPATAP
jgi:UDP-GlcNAc:undecaprenyl-phosphate/decaprenyl-phosphate GlcNAc-1-phosphate transferase